VMTAERALVERAREEGFQCVWLGLGATELPFDGGCDDAAGETAAAAVELAADKMRRFEKGLRENSRVHLLKSPWVEPRVAPVELVSVVA
jgi:hypothetical protein